MHYIHIIQISQTWPLGLRTPSGSLKHFGEAEGYRLSRPFLKSAVTLENQLLVAGVGDGIDPRRWPWRFTVFTFNAPAQSWMVKEKSESKVDDLESPILGNHNPIISPMLHLWNINHDLSHK